MQTLHRRKNRHEKKKYESKKNEPDPRANQKKTNKGTRTKTETACPRKNEPERTANRKKKRIETRNDPEYKSKPKQALEENVKIGRRVRRPHNGAAGQISSSQPFLYTKRTLPRCQRPEEFGAGAEIKPTLIPLKYTRYVGTCGACGVLVECNGITHLPHISGATAPGCLWPHTHTLEDTPERK